MTSNSLSTMYIGVTSDIGRRVFEHRNGKGSEFAAKYRVTRLVYVEEFENPTEAIARERQLVSDAKDLIPSTADSCLDGNEVLRCAQDDR
jgi:predicted GIY-YIG superfamily endonuclease